MAITCTHCYHPCHCANDGTADNDCVNGCSVEGCNCTLCDCHDIPSDED